LLLKAIYEILEVEEVFRPPKAAPIGILKDSTTPIYEMIFRSPGKLKR
jgi:hypothetical protein